MVTNNLSIAGTIVEAIAISRHPVRIPMSIILVIATAIIVTTGTRHQLLCHLYYYHHLDYHHHVHKCS